jgi:hypothetical protein
VIDVRKTTEHVVGAIDASAQEQQPFAHLRFAEFFPQQVYAAILQAMPARESYGAMSGRARHARGLDGSNARTRIDLFPEGVIRLPGKERRLWGAIGEVLRSPAVGAAWMRRLAEPLERRFGAEFRNLPMYPIPLLTRDIPGYRIGLHADTPRKGITVQIYLPRDGSITHVGTVFHERNGEPAARVPFSPNTGYAFAVDSHTYHSVDPVGPEVRTRDSILLNYFVDETWLQVAQNRSKRMGHLIRGLGWRRSARMR